MNVLFRLRYNNVKTFYNETRGYVTLNPCMIKIQIRGFLLKKNYKSTECVVLWPESQRFSFEL